MKLPRATEPAFPPGPQECWPPGSGRGPWCPASTCGGGDFGWRRSDRNLLESVSICVGRLLNLTLLSALPFWSGNNSLLLFLSVGQVAGWRPRKQALKGRTACRMFVKKALGVSTWAGREALSWDASRGQPAAWPTAGSSGASELLPCSTPTPRHQALARGCPRGAWPWASGWQLQESPKEGKGLPASAPAAGATSEGKRASQSPSQAGPRAWNHRVKEPPVAKSSDFTGQQADRAGHSHGHVIQ